jgi:hypothetical protein
MTSSLAAAVFSDPRALAFDNSGGERRGAYLEFRKAD